MPFGGDAFSGHSSRVTSRWHSKVLQAQNNWFSQRTAILYAARYSKHVLSAEWLKNAFWRTTVALIPKLAETDDAFAKHHLSAEEYSLYKQMDVRDRDHAWDVTKTLMTDYPEAPPRTRAGGAPARCRQDKGGL